LKTVSSGWAAAQPEPDKEKVDWDLYLDPPRGGPTIRRFSTASILKKAAVWSEAVVWNGVALR